MTQNNSDNNGKSSKNKNPCKNQIRKFKKQITELEERLEIEDIKRQEAEWSLEEKKDEIKQELASKVNGDIIMSLTGLKDKELGQFIRTFRAKYDDDWLLKMSREDVMVKITIHYEESEFY